MTITVAVIAVTRAVAAKLFGGERCWQQRRSRDVPWLLLGGLLIMSVTRAVIVIATQALAARSREGTKRAPACSAWEAVVVAYSADAPMPLARLAKEARGVLSRQRGPKAFLVLCRRDLKPALI